MSLTLGQEPSPCLLNVRVVGVHISSHVQGPFHVFMSTEVLEQHRDVKEHVEVVSK